MQSSDRGRKHRCAACGVAFYDMQRELTVCPKCETPYEATAHLPQGEPPRRRQSRSKQMRPPQPESVPETPPAAANEDGGEDETLLDAPDDADEAEVENEAPEDDESAVRERDQA